MSSAAKGSLDSEKTKGEGQDVSASDATDGSHSSYSKSVNSSKNQSNSSLKKDGSSINSSSEQQRVRRPAGRVVQSRYRAAATSKAASNNNNSSSNSKNSLNTTVTAAPKSKQPHKLQPHKSSQMSLSQVGGLAQSKTQLAAPAPGGRSAHKQRAEGRTTATRQKENGQNLAKLSGSVHGSKAKLHSTILNCTMLMDATRVHSPHDVFSTTLVGGLAHGGSKLDSKKLDVTGVSLPELPDISAIKLESNTSGNKSGEAIAVPSSALQNQPDVESCVPVSVTAEDLEREYMQYLQWVYLHDRSNLAFNTQVNKLQNQLLFLEELVSEKQSEINELKQKTSLVTRHEQVTECYDQQLEALQKLVAGSAACEDAERVLSEELEKNLHQVKMENIFIPENHDQYREELSAALQENALRVEQLKTMVEPQTKHLSSSINLLEMQKNTLQDLQQCENEILQASRLAIQEASLHIGRKRQQMQV